MHLSLCSQDRSGWIPCCSPSGALPVKQWLPKFDEAGAVKKGEVEMIAAAALKATKAAGIMRKIKVQ